MKRGLITALKTVGCLAVFVAVLAIAAAFTVNSPKMQNKVQRKAVTLLSEKLGTKVEIDSVSIDFWKGGVSLYNIGLWDQKDVQMLKADTVKVSLGLWELMQKSLQIKQATLAGCKVVLYKITPDSVANYQFVIDSLKRKPTADLKTKTEKKKKQKFSFDIGSVTLRRIEVDYETKRLFILPIARSKRAAALIAAEKRKGIKNPPTEEIRWLMQKIKLGELTYKKARFGKHNKGKLTIRNLSYWNDNGLPRKNTIKKKRGWFDPKHLDVTMNMDIDVNYLEADSISVALTDATAVDSLTGFDISDLRLKATLKKGVARISDFHAAQQKNTTLEFDSATMFLPDKKTGQKLQYRTSEIRGKTLLKNISRPFTPVLKDFSLPLELRVQVAGTDTTMMFNNIFVYTPDSLFKLYAYGDIKDMLNKYDMVIHFKVKQMVAKAGVKHKIINQFPVKKYMMKQVSKLGTIRYNGNIYILWRKEQFDGQLNTAVGGLNFNFCLDEEDKYLVGEVGSRKLDLGKATDMKQLGNLACNASFKFDISKPRTAQMRKKIGGKLPMGSVDARVHEAYFKKMKFSNIHATLESNGAIAQGNITMRGKRMDGLCSFSFTNTDSISKMKIKPGIRFHKAGETEQEARAKAAAKEKAKAEKAAKKAAAAEEKARKKAEKAAAKEKAKAEKAARKAAEAAAKANKE